MVNPISGMGLQYICMSVRFSRWSLVFLVLALLAGTTAIVQRWETHPRGIDWVNYTKIRRGMTHKEVSRVLGDWGDY